jgi:cell division protein FtsQ
MRLKINIKNELKITAVLIILFVLIGFSENQNSGVVCKDITVKLQNTRENHYMDEKDVIQLLTRENELLIGASITRLNLRELEQRLKSDRTIERAEIFTDLKGNMAVNVKLRRPIARIIRNDGPDAYVTEDGSIMSVSDKYTSRVMLIGGAFVNVMLKYDNLYDFEQGAQLMRVINHIHHDDFWRAQIAQLNIDKKVDIVMLPQVTRQKIEFGTPDDIAHKFKKLKIFYKEILPGKGWNTYDKVNLKYYNQIITE